MAESGKRFSLSRKTRPLSFSSTTSMPSLFSRSRTTSSPAKTPKPTQNDDAVVYDEFGRISSRTSALGVSLPSARKDNKKKESRSRTVSTARGKGNAVVDDEGPQIPDGSFLALSLEPPTRLDVGEVAAAVRERDHDYGYLSYQRHVILGLEETDRLVKAIADELGTRGLTTPFIFSSLALDINTPGVRRLIQAFIRTCSPSPGRDVEAGWRDEIRFAGPHELGMCLRWGLARVVRLVGGNAVRGLVAWDFYVEWSEAEILLNYPPTHFAEFVKLMPPPLQAIIINVLTLLTRLTAHSASSGHTPPTLSPLFGPLVFGLGPAALPFHHTYVHYLRATNAMEHLILSFIRFQDTPNNTSNSSLGHGSATSMGVPTRLKDWIRGYPAMLPAARTKKEKLSPRRGARTVRVVSVRRNVRFYTPDLVKNAASWGTRTPESSGGGLASSREWERVAPSTLKLSPRYADGYKKRMDLPVNFHPNTGPGSPSTVSSSGSTTSASGSLTSNDDYLLGKPKGESLVNEERFRNLADLKWGEFESVGFGGLGTDEKKLQFDLTESARTSRTAKRQTLTWTDFSSSGFSRTDAPLNATLQFSAPVSNTISSWPSNQAEITRKLKKTQRALPPFGWDTNPVMGSEEVIEEAFVDVFCDLVYGGGWMDMEREEELDRECNWALVEFKALPVAKSTVTGDADPRTSQILFLFEEFVPLEYRQQLTSGNKRKLVSLFTTTKSKQWKPAATLNGRPYVIGHVPRTATYGEVDFEGMLRGGNSSTKVLSLNKNGAVKSVTTGLPPPSIGAAQISSPLSTKQFAVISGQRAGTPTPSAAPRSDSPSTPVAGSPVTGKKSRFRLIPSVTSPNARKSVIPPSEYENVDFETRLASYSDDELNESNGTGDPTTSKSQRRQSKDDAWVDILVANSGRRLNNQEAELRVPRGRGLKGGRSDPELASMEVAAALAAVQGKVPDDEDDEGDDIEPMTMSGAPVHTTDTDTLDDTPSVTDTGGAETAEYDTEEGAVPPPTTQQRRMGYFELHPERRPPHTASDDEDDDEDDPRGAIGRRSRDTDDMTDYPPLSAGPTQSIMMSDDFEAVDEPSPGFPHHDRDYDAAPISPPAAPEKSPAVPAKPVSNKTAALIEMYRERERGGNIASPVARVPVIPPKSKERDITPSVTPPSHTKTPPQADKLEPPVLEFEPRAESPSRYVHGAPLHNVVEEEEEEEA